MDSSGNIRLQNSLHKTSTVWRPKINSAKEPTIKRQMPKAISSLISKGAIKEVVTHPEKFLSTVFLIEKKDRSGDFRPVIDLKGLNQFLPKKTFMIEGLNTARSLLHQGDFMMKINLKDAYYSILVQPNYRKYLISLQVRRFNL